MAPLAPTVPATAAVEAVERVDDGAAASAVADPGAIAPLVESAAPPAVMDLLPTLLETTPAPNIEAVEPVEPVAAATGGDALPVIDSEEAVIEGAASAELGLGPRIGDEVLPTTTDTPASAADPSDAGTPIGDAEAPQGDT
ncbi:MAG TPA: hypothetical protein VGQ62_06445, partial [Chloroflexota bacterium]|nr:hypothetical protein [Chloroflexota bacterium]